jgi:hypothetical protein
MDTLTNSLICHELAMMTRKYCHLNLPTGFNYPFNPETVPEFQIILPRNSQIYEISVCIVPDINYVPDDDLRTNIYRNNISLDNIDWIVYETTLIDYEGNIIDDTSKRFSSIGGLLEEIVNVKNNISLTLNENRLPI